MSDLLLATQKNMIRRLKLARDKAVFSNFTWNNLSFDCDQVSQPRILGMLVAAGAGGFPLGGISWRLADNSWTTILAADMPGIFQSMQAHIQAQFATFAEHEQIINSMTDPDSVVAYSVEVF
jgi:hypothetical protein